MVAYMSETSDFSAGADVSVVNYAKWPALLLAVRNGHTDLVQQLIDKGAHIHYRDDSGNTAINIAANYNFNPDCIPLLLKLGADIETRDMNGRTPLQAAAFLGNHVAFKSLIEAGADTEPVCSPDKSIDAGLSQLVNSEKQIEMQELLATKRAARNKPRVIEPVTITTHIQHDTILSTVPKLRIGPR